MMLAAIIALVGAVVQASTFSLGQSIAGRIISGFGVGIFTGTVPMYVSETADARHKGSLVLLEGVFALSGIALAAWINFGIYHASGSVTFRFPLAFQLLFILVLLACCPFLPESPRWLVLQQRNEEAAVILSRLMDRDVDSPEVTLEVNNIFAAIQLDQGHRNKYSHNPFSMNKNRHLHRTLLACGMTTLTQLTGINVIPFYSSIILEGTLHYSPTVARILSGCLNITLALGGLTAIFVVERVGRRKLMLASTFGMVVCQAAVAGLSSDLSNPTSGQAALFFYFAALYILPVGMFIIPFMYASEISPLGIRYQVAGMAAASSWLFNFMVAEVTPIAIDQIHWEYYLVFASCSTVGCFAIYFLVPETQGRTLEEIDLIFLKSNSIFDMVRVAREFHADPDHFELEPDDKSGAQVAYEERL
ncbi:unnamed protein product, partial [Aureobasidium mustum]